MIKFYVTFDKIGESYSMPFPAKNDNVAKRNMLIASKRESLPLDDIQLFCVGLYDFDNGTFDSFSERIEVPLFGEENESKN